MPGHLTRSTPLAGRYLLTDQVGVGAMGSVWRAWDLRDRRWVAAKVLSRYDSGLLQRFVREQSLRIRHPHVLEPTGWAAADDRVFFTMDLVRGGSVEDLVTRHGPLPDGFVRVLLEQTLGALVAVHAAGVVHRDVKPSNLLLDPTGTGRPFVRLGDFGVAAFLDEARLTQLPGVVGTPGYLPPDQVPGAPPDPRQDLYAAGVVAVHLLTGLRPRHHADPPTGPLQPLLRALTHPDADARPASAAEALTRLRAVGVPAGTPWLAEPHPPDVRDLLGGSEPGEGAGAGSAAYALAALACFAGATLLSALVAWLVLR